MAPLDALARSAPVNAALGWLSIGVAVVAAVQSLRAGAVPWAAFTGVIVLVGVLPPVRTRNWSAMAPWPLLLVAAVAALVGGTGVRPEVAGYVVVAGLALLTAVELDAFTDVEMSRRFAVGFAVLTTLAVQGLWVIVQYYSDAWLGTGFLHTQRELQVDIVVVTAVGLAMGAVFEWYFARVDHVGSHRRPHTRPGEP